MRNENNVVAAKRGEDIGNHPTNYFHLVPPIKDDTCANKTKRPAKKQQENRKREESPSYGVDVERVEEVNNTCAESNGYDEFTEGEKEHAIDPFR